MTEEHEEKIRFNVRECVAQLLRSGQDVKNINTTLDRLLLANRELKKADKPLLDFNVIKQDILTETA